MKKDAGDPSQAAYTWQGEGSAVSTKLAFAPFPKRSRGGTVLGGEPISPPIGEALTLATLKEHRGALAVRDFAGVVAK